MQDEEGHNLSIGQEAKDIEEGMDPSTTSTQLKRSRIIERSGLRKRVKAYRLAIDSITVIEGDLYDIDDMAREVTKEAVHEAMSKQ